MEKVVVADNPTSLTLEAGVPIVIRAIDGETGMPVLDATVRISGLPESINGRSEPVDEEGEFHTRFPVSPPRVTIQVHHAELATTKWVSLRGGTGSGDFEFKLRRRGKVRGRVVDFESGDPCAGVPVRVVSGRQVIARRLSRGDGTFEISVPAGRFTLSVGTGNGFYAECSTESSIQIEAGETTEVGDLPAIQLPKIGGIVLMPSGEPAARALVVYDEYGVDPQLTDENGRFEFQILRREPAGVHLRASHMTEKWSSGRAIRMDEAMLAPIPFNKA